MPILDTLAPMFQEIPSRPAPPSPRLAIAFFGGSFLCFLLGSAIIWVRWSGPMSLIRKIIVAQFIVGGILSAVFLLTAKSVSPEVNRKRLLGLCIAVWAFQFVIDVLQ
jgi:hypothetical protein